MQLSREEYLKVSQMRIAPASGPSTVGVMATAPARRGGIQTETPLRRSGEVQRVVEAVDHASDIREDIVASLRARIESGSYQVSGDAVAEMLLRRLLADRVR